MALGGRTIAEWQQIMSSEEFVDWQLYYEMNPFGPRRGDIQAGVVASIIANVNAAKGKRYKVSDFMPEFRSSYHRQQEEIMSPDQIKSFFETLADARKGSA